MIKGMRMMPLEDALVRAEAEEANNGPLLRVLRSAWARSLKNRTVSREWVAYEYMRDAWRRHVDQAREWAKWD
jgi:hypothetical protein